VVDTRSMLRAEACFRKQGIQVVPAATSLKDRRLADEWMPDAEVILRNELTLHESLGMVWYWMRGRV